MPKLNKTKWFRVAREGATTDGRKITGEQIAQMAKNYNPSIYGARIWLEHFRGLVPGGPFDALGDVLALKSEKIDDGKLGLYAQIEPLPGLIAINKAKQKIYSSIELDPAFADTGEAYFVGMAVTDSPASLSTEILEFSAKAEANPFTARKQKPQNLFTAAEALEGSFIDVDEPPVSALFSDLKSFITTLFKSEKTMPTKEELEILNTQAPVVVTAPAPAPATPAITAEKTENKFSAEQVGQFKNLFAEATKPLEDKFAALDERLKKLEAQPDPAQAKAGKYSGAPASTLTDC